MTTVVASCGTSYDVSSSVSTQEFCYHAATEIRKNIQQTSNCWGERIRTSDWLIQNSPSRKGRQSSVLIASEHRVAKKGTGRPPTWPTTKTGTAGRSSLLLALILLASAACGVKQPDGSIIDMKQDKANKEIAACIEHGGTATSASRADAWYGYVIEVTCTGMVR